MNDTRFWFYLAVMASVTYLIRMLPLVLIKKRIKNRFLLSFLYYIPYTVLSVMTIPAIFASTSSFISASVGFLSALVMAFFRKGLLSVASTACVMVFATEAILKII